MTDVNQLLFTHYLLCFFNEKFLKNVHSKYESKNN